MFNRSILCCIPKGEGEADDFHAQFEDEVLQVFGAFALQEADGFEDFEARADGVAEGLVDVGHEGHALAVERAGEWIGLMRLRQVGEESH